MSSDDRLFAAHYLPVMRLCLSRLRDAADAEDAVQEVFGRALQHADALGDDPLPWLITVAKNVCNDELRRRRRAQQLADPAPPAAPPDVTVVGRLSAVELLGRLTPGERRAVAARLDGAAAATSTTRVLLARARQKLRDYLAESQSAFGTATVYSSEALHRLRSRFFGRALVDSGRAAVVIPAVLAIGMVTAPFNPSAPDAVPGSSVAGLIAPATGDALQARRLRNETEPSDDLLSGLTRGTVSNPIPSGPPAPQLPPHAGPVWGTAPLQFDPHQVNTLDIQPSPNYAHDHTVWLIGQNHSCLYEYCSQIWVSTDGGVTWSFVPPQSVQVQGHQLLLPANGYPDYFYSYSSFAGLQVTRDSGRNFAPVLPAGSGGYATQPPTWTGLDAMVSVGDTLWSVPHSSGSPQLLSTFGSGGTAASAPLVLPFGQGWVALQAVRQPGYPVQMERCAPVCGPTTTVPANIYLTKLLASPNVAVDHTVYLVGLGLTTMVSHDDGATFTVTGSNEGGDMMVTRGPKGNRLIETAPTVFKYSDDDGRTWTRATVTPSVLTDAHSVTQLRPGRLIASMMRSDDGGWYFFVCSSDGAAWSLCTPDQG